MSGATPTAEKGVRHDPRPEPAMYDPRVGGGDTGGGVFGLKGQDSDMEYCWALKDNSGPYGPGGMRKMGYEVQRYGGKGGLQYEFGDPMHPPKDGDPIIDGEMVLLGRLKVQGESVRENGYRTTNGMAGGMDKRRRYEAIRDAQVRNSGDGQEATLTVEGTGAVRGAVPW